MRRPDDLRVEPVGGQDGRAEVFHTRPAQGSVSVSWNGRRPAEPEPFRVLRQGDPGFPAPTIGADGLVTALPEFSHGFLDYDDPTPGDYHFVAMLNPVELADGDDGDGPPASSGPGARPLGIEDLAVVQHHGRAAWQAVLTPTDRYRPRCDCCALLYTALSADRVGFPADGLPSRYRVRLDVQTGVCVQTVPLTSDPGVGRGTAVDGEAAVGGDVAVDRDVAVHGHDLAIEAVDEPMSDELFDLGTHGAAGRVGPLRRLLR